MALNSPIPSKAFDVLEDNMETTDEFVNSTALSVATRGAPNGNASIRTIAGINASADTTIADVLARGNTTIADVQGRGDDAIDNIDINALPRLPWVTGTTSTNRVQTYVFNGVIYIAPEASQANPVTLSLDPVTGAPDDDDWFAYLDRGSSIPFKITITGNNVTTVQIVNEQGDPIQFRSIARVNLRRTTLIPDTDYTVSPGTNSITLINGIVLNAGDIIYGSVGADVENGGVDPVWISASGTMTSGNNFLLLGVSALDVKGLAISGWSPPDSVWTINSGDNARLDMTFTANENYEFTALVRTL